MCWRTSCLRRNHENPNFTPAPNLGAPHERGKIMSLQNQLDDFRTQFESGGPLFNVPRSIIDTIHRATKELIASGQAARAKKVGDAAPGFALKDPDGRVVSSAELL